MNAWLCIVMCAVGPGARQYDLHQNVGAGSANTFLSLLQYAIDLKSLKLYLQRIWKNLFIPQSLPRLIKTPGLFVALLNHPESSCMMIVWAHALISESPNMYVAPSLIKPIYHGSV